MDIRETKMTREIVITNAYGDHRKLLGRIIDSYSSSLVRYYCKVRFTIININILHMLALCLRGKQRILDIGCGFGLFGCYFAALYPEIEYHGYDLNSARIEMANQAASGLGLTNANFYCRDARELNLEGSFDAIMMIDLMHHIDDISKNRLIETCVQHLSYDGRLIIKDVTTQPLLKIAFTWALDVFMTRSFDMWYWDEIKYHHLLNQFFQRIEVFPITDWLPYPHIIYLSEIMK